MRKDAVNEVKVLSSLKHPYVVAYRESFVERERKSWHSDGLCGRRRLAQTRPTHSEGEQADI